MTSNRRLHQEKEYGARTARFSEDHHLENIFEKMEARLISQWRDSAPEDSEFRHEAYLSLRLLGDLRGELTRIIARGRAAEHILERNEDEAIR